MTLTNEEKLANYEYAVYELEEFLKCKIEELSEDWHENPQLAFQRGMLNAYKESLHSLTLDSKWNLPLENLRNLLLPDILIHTERGEL